MTHHSALIRILMGHGLLNGKTGIIFGALDERSIAWRVALACHREGASFALSNAPIALRLGQLNALGEATGAEIEADGDGGEDDAEGLTAEADLDAVRGVGDSDGLVSESGNRGGGHASGRLSKSRTPRRE